MESNRKLLIQDMKDSGRFTRFKENPLMTYYTCVKYIKVHERYIIDGHPIEFSHEASPWSCMKGWFETYNYTFRDKCIDHKVHNYFRFRDATAALKKDIGEPFNIYVDKNR